MEKNQEDQPQPRIGLYSRAREARLATTPARQQTTTRLEPDGDFHYGGIVFDVEDVPPSIDIYMGADGSEKRVTQIVPADDLEARLSIALTTYPDTVVVGEVTRFVRSETLSYPMFDPRYNALRDFYKD